MPGFDPSAMINNAGAAVSDIYSSQASAAGLRIKAQGTRLQAVGNRVEAANYDAASTLATQNEQFTEQSTAIKQTMADRQIYQGIGTEQADIAGAGFASSGSALDLLRDSASQGAMQKQILGQQGLITEAGYTEQAQSYTSLAGYARYSAAQEDDIANQTDKLADSAAKAGRVAAFFHAAAAGAGPAALAGAWVGGVGKS